jgi:hypothetical protein
MAMMPTLTRAARAPAMDVTDMALLCRDLDLAKLDLNSTLS